MLVLLSACDSFSFQSSALQRTLHKQQHKADKLVEQLIQAIEANNFDSIWQCSQVDKSILCYIYKGRQLLYWSNSWLSASERIVRQVQDQWHFAQWDNAQGICRKIQVGDYSILIAIPIKYDYSVTSPMLHNFFIAPFRGDEEWRLTFHQGGEEKVPIYSYDGLYLFSVEKKIQQQLVRSSDEVIENFSYQAILATDQQEQASAKAKLRMYYIITGLMIGVLLFVAIISLVKYRGFRRMKLGGKFQLVLIPLVLVILLSIFMLSVEYIQRLFVETQQLRLRKKAQYVQMALQNMYFWDLGLSPSNTASLTCGI